MHVHLPKPLHGWREFVGEVGIIVLGVLIALTAEQIVEHFREEALLRDAEQRMTEEIRDDDAPQAFARAAIRVCNTNQLDALEAAVEKGDRTEIARLASDYRPPLRTWDDQAWKSALASQALKSQKGDRAIAWATIYIVLPVANDWTAAEQEALRHLRAKIGGAGPLSTVQKDRLFQLIADLRWINSRMSGGSQAFLRYASMLGITVTPSERASILAEARRDYGSCVVDPARVRPTISPSAQYEATPHVH